MKKLFTMCALAGIAFAGQTDMQKLEERVTNLELTTPMDTEGARLANGHRDTCNDFLMKFDLLYWHPKTDFTDNGSTSNTGTNSNNGSRTTYMDFNWQFGFKVGLGYHLDDDDWHLLAEFTRVDFNDSYNTSPGGTNDIHSNFGAAGDSSGNVQSMKYSHSIDYQTLTLTLGKRFFVSKKVSLMPNFGAKATWINQDPRVNQQFVDAEGSSTVLGDQHIDITEKTRSVGPMGLLQANWYLCGGWSFYADGGLALLFTSYRGRMAVQGIIANIVFDSTFRESNKENKHYVVPNLFVNLGLAYEHHFAEWDHNLKLSLGYESQYYVNQSYLMQNQNIVTVNTPQGAWFARNLAVYGLTASASYEF
jgi:hypothetical protein